MSEWLGLAGEAAAIWDTLAQFWDAYMGEAGNQFHQELVRPSVLRLLDWQAGEQVLEIGCGNGNFARQLAAAGATVLATDYSPTMLSLAQAYPTAPHLALTYQILDATDEAQIRALGHGRFAAAVANMVLMDIPLLEPLLQGLRWVLKGNGRFIFATVHPCFWTPDARRVVEQDEKEGHVTTRFGLNIAHYATPTPYKGLGIQHQPQPQYYFHRPLHTLFAACFRAGFVIDGLEEPTFAQGNPQTPFSWVNFREIPPILIVRLRSI